MQQGTFINEDLNPVLLEAALCGNRAQIGAALDKRADIECRDPTSQSTPLMVSARVGLSANVEYLLKRGADILASDAYGRTALHLACWKGAVDAGEALLKWARNKDIRIINARANGGDTALHEAAEFGQKECVRLCLQFGAMIDATAYDGTPLFKASREGHDSVVDLLLRKGANPGYVYPNGRSTAMHVAAHGGHYRVIRALLHYAKNTKKPQAAAAALTESKDADEWRPLHVAAKRGDLKSVKELLLGGCDVNATNGGGYTPIILCASSGRVDTLELLLEHGAHVNAENRDRNSALHMACVNCDDAMVACLLKRGAALEAVNIGKSTPLLVAVSAGDLDSTELLLDAGADVNAIDHHGNTALLRAASLNFLGMVELLLLKRGPEIDATVVNKQGKTAYWAAYELGHTRVCEVLYPYVAQEAVEETVAEGTGEGYADGGQWGTDHQQA
jgi:hypothetical protein